MVFLSCYSIMSYSGTCESFVFLENHKIHQKVKNKIKLRIDSFDDIFVIIIECTYIENIVVILLCGNLHHYYCILPYTYI